MDYLELQNEVLTYGFDDNDRSQVKRFLNEGEARISRSLAVFLPVWQKQEVIATVAGTKELDLPEDFRAVRRIVFEDTNYRIPESLEPLDEVFLEITGRPSYFYVDEGKVKFYPTPSSALNIIFKYYSRPKGMTDNFDRPELPEDYHHILVTYAVGRMFRLKRQQQDAQSYFQEYVAQIQEMRTDLYELSDHTGEQIPNPYEYSYGEYGYW